MWLQILILQLPKIIKTLSSLHIQSTNNLIKNRKFNLKKKIQNNK